MFTRTFRKPAEQEFIRERTDEDFPDTDKMPLREMDFEDSVVAQEMAPDTVPASLMSEFEESKTAALKASVEIPKDDKPLWQFEFTDSALDLKAGTKITEEEIDADLFSKYFDR